MRSKVAESRDFLGAKPDRGIALRAFIMHEHAGSNCMVKGSGLGVLGLKAQTVTAFNEEVLDVFTTQITLIDLTDALFPTDSGFAGHEPSKGSSLEAGTALGCDFAQDFDFTGT